MLKLLSALYARAEDTPSRPALLFYTSGSYVQFGFGDLLFETERWARRYLAAGLAAQSIVAIVLDHRVDMYGAYLGAMRAGLVPTFLPYRTPKQDETLYWKAQAAVFDRLWPACIVTYRAPLERIAELTRDFTAHRIDVDAPWPQSAAPLPDLREVEADDRIALLQHSSGTTGAKKGVALTFAAISAQAQALGNALPAAPGDRTVSWLPLYHDMGLLTAFLLPVIWGSSVISFDAFEWLARPNLFFELSERFRATHAWLPNFALNHLVRTCADGRRFDLSSFRAIVSTSEPCRAETFRRFDAAFETWGLHPKTLRASYGMAEAVFACTLTDSGRVPHALESDGFTYLSCGRALEGIDIRIQSADDSPVGEIAVRGRYVVSEYFRNAEITAASFEDGWFRTGDVGFFSGDELFVCGRTKEMLIVHGRNFYANDIEAVVQSVPGVKAGRVVAIGRYDEATASEEASILAESDEPDDEARVRLARTIRATIFSALGLHVRTVRVIPVGTLHKTTSGKMSRDDNAPFLENDAFGVHA